MDKALETYNKIKNDDEVLHISEVASLQGELSEPYSLGHKIFDDAFKGGVRKGDLVVVTGISGEGKSFLLQHFTINFSKQNYKSVWFTYEISVNDLYSRFKEMGVQDNSLLAYTPKKHTTGHLTWIKEKIIEAQKKYGAQFVFIDHIEFLTPANTRSTEQYRFMLGQVCQELKTMAIELGFCVFLAVHVKKVEGRMIEMQDITESSSIYKLADIVFGIGRKQEKVTNEFGTFDRPTNEGIVRVLKNRVDGTQYPYMIFWVENHVIIPVNPEPKKEDVKPEIEVVDDDMEKRLQEIPF